MSCCCVRRELGGGAGSSFSYVTKAHMEYIIINGEAIMKSTNSAEMFGRLCPDLFSLDGAISDKN